MLKGIRVRIYPNRAQKNLIENTFGCCRLVYNKGLALRKDAYAISKESVGYKEGRRFFISQSSRFYCFTTIFKRFG